MSLPPTQHDPAGPMAASVSTTETLSLLEEVLRVGKRTVETGRVRVSVLTDVQQHQVRETLRSRRVEVDRVTSGRRLEPGEAMPQSRLEGEVLIVPIVEEMMVLEKRLVVTEELHIRVVHADELVERQVPLRRQRAVVEHLPPANDDVAP